MQLPPLNQGELEALRESIRQDGVKYPVLLDRSGQIIDGYHRRQVAEELGVDYRTETLDVDDETADRLRITLNLARRQLTTLDRDELLQVLAGKYEETAQREALERKVLGGREGGLSKHGETVAPSLRGPRARDIIAERINADLASFGEIMRVTGRQIDDARRAARLPEATKARIRAGETSVNAEIRRSRAAAKVTPPTSQKPERQLPEHVIAQARIRKAHAESLYRSMLNAPQNKLNLPLIERASKIQEFLVELSAVPVERAVTQLPAMRCREFNVEMAKWWLEFVTACEARRAAETPELSTLHKRSLLDVLNPVVAGSSQLPVPDERLLRPSTRAALDWLRRQSEPVTAVQVAVGIRGRRSTATDDLRLLCISGLAAHVGRVDGHHLYRATN
jgi:Predicted transcriptional regulators